MKFLLRLRNFFVSAFSSSSAIQRLSLRRHQHPMDRLPNEILSYIFLITLHDPDQNPSFSIVISHVCSRWRDLALSTGDLWTRIVLTFPITSQQLVCASASLTRSGTYPLDILLDCRDPEWDWEEETHRFDSREMETILRLLMTYVDRWKSIEILTDTWAPMFTFLWFTRNVGHAPCLELIGLSRCNAYFASRGQVFQPSSLRYPIALFGGIMLERLRNVSLVGVHLDWDQSSLQNLVDLEFKYHASDVMPTLKQFAHLLAASPALRHLSIIGWGPILAVEKDIDTGAIQLPSLTKLSFGFIDVAYSTTLLSLFNLPSLEHLLLEDVAKTVNPLEPRSGVNILQWLSSRHATQGMSAAASDTPVANTIPLGRIRTLELQAIRADQETFFNFFQHFPLLENLRCCDVPDDLLLALAPQTINAQRTITTQVVCVCPILSEIYCQDSNPDFLIDVVASRSFISSVIPLQNVTLEFIRNLRPAITSETYIRLVDTGIQVHGGSNISDDSGSD